ncbi:MAG: RNA polymerase sigma factor [Desulfobacterales bacterium]
MDPFQDFYRNQRKAFFAYLFRRTADPSLASDILQESFTRLYASYPAERWNARLLFTIGRHLLIDALRRRKREADPPPEEDASAPSLEERLLAREEARRVLAAMQRLDEEERDLLSLVASGGLSYREIASLTGQSEGNIRVKVHRARCRLRALLESGNS